MGVTFGAIHSDTWGLMMTDFSISPPVAKTKFISIPGRDGDLDLSEALGDIRYENRGVFIQFVVPGGASNANLQTIFNTLHGKTTTIKFDHDPDYYYTGRASVAHSQEDEKHGILQIRADCQPFKSKSSLTTVSKVATTSGVVATCTVAHRKVMPQITTNAAVQVTFGGNNYNISAGTTTMPFYLSPGENSITLTTASGTANVDIKWREQSL